MIRKCNMRGCTRLAKVGEYCQKHHDYYVEKANSECIEPHCRHKRFKNDLCVNHYLLVRRSELLSVAWI